MGLGDVYKRQIYNLVNTQDVFKTYITKYEIWNMITESENGHLYYELVMMGKIYYIWSSNDSSNILLHAKQLSNL